MLVAFMKYSLTAAERLMIIKRASAGALSARIYIRAFSNEKRWVCGKSVQVPCTGLQAQGRGVYINGFPYMGYMQARRGDFL